MIINVYCTITFLFAITFLLEKFHLLNLKKKKRRQMNRKIRCILNERKKVIYIFSSCVVEKDQLKFFNHL